MKRKEKLRVEDEIHFRECSQQKEGVYIFEMVLHKKDMQWNNSETIPDDSSCVLHKNNAFSKMHRRNEMFKAFPKMHCKVILPLRIPFRKCLEIVLYAIHFRKCIMFVENTLGTV